MRRTQHVGRQRQMALSRQDLGQPEIRQVGLIVGIEDNIPRLEIAMQNAVLVRVLHGAIVVRTLRRRLEDEERRGQQRPPVG